MKARVDPETKTDFVKQVFELKSFTKSVLVSGFNLPWWDRALGTYLNEPSQGHAHMTIGLEQYRDPTRLTMLRLVGLPFVGEIGKYPTWHDEQNEDVTGNKE